MTAVNRRTAAQRRRLLLNRLQAVDNSGGAATGAGEIYRTAYPLTCGQQGLWFIERLQPGSPLYLICVAYRLCGQLDVPALRRALTILIERHEAFRTTFHESEGGPVQRVAPGARVVMEVEDLSALTEQARAETVDRRLREETGRGIDLARGPMLATHLFKLGGTEHVILLKTHHIVIDGWSVDLLLRELSLVYSAELAGQPAVLPALRLQYGDHAVRQQRWLTSDEYRRQLDYWRRHLDGVPEVLNLPIARPRRATTSHRGKHVTLSWPASLMADVHRVSRQERVTPFMFILAAFQSLISRYSGQDDIVVGTVVAGRSSLDTEGLIGYFVNTLVMRVDTGGNPSFREMLGRVRSVALGALEHQDVPFERVVDMVRPERAAHHNPIFQVGFSMAVNAQEYLRLPGIDVTEIPLRDTTEKFDLGLTVADYPTGLQVELGYRTDLFDADSIERMGGHLTRLLRAAVDRPELRIKELPLLGPDERTELVTQRNGPERPVVRKCLHELFVDQACRTPEITAIQWGERRFTYAELNSRSDLLARHLWALGVRRGDRVGIYLDRSAELVVSILAVMKAGAAYVPIDTMHPQDRIRVIVEHAGLSVVLTQRRLAALLPDGVRQIDVKDRATWSPAGDSRDLPCIDSRECAYVIYTSGSTGRPKGVLGTHRGTVSLMMDVQRRAPVGVGTTGSLWSSIGFDASVYETFSLLLFGGTLHLVPEETRTDGEAFVSWLQQERIKVTIVPVFILSVLADRLRAGEPLELERISVGGEAAPARLLHEVRNHLKDLSLLYVYGPTETAIFSTVYLIPPEPREDGHAPIGRPVDNNTLYLLDGNLEPVPDGVVGEVFIGGIGIAHGYLHAPRLTAERFLPDPFSETPGNRMFRTGDMARYLPDGNLLFAGRRDNQVKIRGVRVELEEVEVALRRHPSVREASVAAEGEGRERHLAAYVVADERTPVTGQQLRMFLRGVLPHYLVPSTFAFLAALPLSPHGKVSRRDLASTPRLDVAVDQVAVTPRDPLELRLAAMFEGLLDVPTVSVWDDFFALGGGSLLAVQLLAQIDRELEVRLPLATLFESATVESLARCVREQSVQTPWSPLVTLRQGSSAGPPLFLVHPVGGHLLGYVELLRYLPAEQAVYGLQAQGTAAGQTPLASIEEMAGRYVEAVLAVCGGEPLVLGGWSMGGVVAVEMARRMRLLGHRVDGLVLVDADASDFDAPATVLESLQGWFYDLTQQELAVDGLVDLDPAEQLRAVFASVHRQLEIMSGAQDEFERMFRVYDSNMKAGSSYDGKPYPGSAVLLLGDQHDSGQTARMGSSISSLVHGPLRIESVPGDHYSVLREPGVCHVAAVLRDALDAGRAGHRQAPGEDHG
ncbi:amino acid adenylation domain-containing protein [Micromonospora sp. NPDC051227]|uniref:amino acid adenylation domain-containing protein n=1 Tax=Micromonospora sp. NPDC051227 TaxID=3364285 RepID=UPI0037A951F2